LPVGNRTKILLAILIAFSYIGFLFLYASGVTRASIDGYAAEYPNEIALSKQYVAALQKRDTTTLKSRLDPRLLNDKLDSDLEKMSGLFPVEDPVGVTLAGLRWTTSGEGKSKSAVSTFLQYQFADRWILASTNFSGDPSNRIVSAFHVERSPQSLEATNAFTAAGKSLSANLFLMYSIIDAGLIIAAAILCVAVSSLNWKWKCLWMVFILAGFEVVSLNWTDGTFSMARALSFEIPGVGFYRVSQYSPVIVFATIPLGAIVFLIRYGRAGVTDAKSLFAR